MVIVLFTWAAIPCSEMLHLMWLNIRLEYTRGNQSRPFCICLGWFIEWYRGNRQTKLWSCVLPPHNCSVDLLYVWYRVE